LDAGTVIRNISIYAIPVMAAIILHEVAHGWVAEKFGDSTARRAGRITLNPISHIDPIGTVLLPLVLVLMGSKYLFGWAKPVPVNFAALRNPKRDMIWVALSGPGTNFTLGLLSAIVLRLILAAFPNVVYMTLGQDLRPHLVHTGGLMGAILVPIVLMLCASVLVNAVLMTLNLIPVPPLDGGRIMTGILPGPLAYKFSRIEPFGMLILILLIFVIPFTQKLFGVAIFLVVYGLSLVAGISVLDVLF